MPMHIVQLDPNLCQNWRISVNSVGRVVVVLEEQTHALMHADEHDVLMLMQSVSWHRGLDPVEWCGMMVILLEWSKPHE